MVSTANSWSAGWVRFGALVRRFKQHLSVGDHSFHTVRADTLRSGNGKTYLPVESVRRAKGWTIMKKLQSIWLESTVRTKHGKTWNLSPLWVGTIGRSLEDPWLQHTSARNWRAAHQAVDFSHALIVALYITTSKRPDVRWKRLSMSMANCHFWPFSSGIRDDSCARKAFRAYLQWAVRTYRSMSEDFSLSSTTPQIQQKYWPTNRDWWQASKWMNECMYVRMHACTYVPIHVCMHVRTYVCMYVFLSFFLSFFMYVHIHIHTHIL